MIANKYAKILIDSSASSENISELKICYESITATPAVSRFFISSIDNKLAANIFDKMASQYKISHFVSRFFKILIKNKRISYIPEILKAYKKSIDIQNSKKTLSITTSRPLSDADKSTLHSKLEKQLDATLTLNYELDRTLLGGMVIKSKDMMIDSSIKSILSSINKNQRILTGGY
jgi:F-type H+-transporting ATPase subunit delta